MFCADMRSYQDSAAIRTRMINVVLSPYNDTTMPYLRTKALQLSNETGVPGKVNESEAYGGSSRRSGTPRQPPRSCWWDNGWKIVEVEPETIGVNNSRHSDAIGIGSTVDLAPVNGHAPAYGNGHAPQRNRPPRRWRDRRAAADAVLLGRVHGRGAAQAQGSSPGY